MRNPRVVGKDSINVIRVTARNQFSHWRSRSVISPLILSDLSSSYTDKAQPTRAPKSKMSIFIMTT